jgi:hypothetical protein
MIDLRLIAYLLPVGAFMLADVSPSEAGGSDAATKNTESFPEFLQRIKDELLWPRILVRTSPPPDEDQPTAPDRPLRTRAGRRTHSFRMRQTIT